MKIKVLITIFNETKKLIKRPRKDTKIHPKIAISALEFLKSLKTNLLINNPYKNKQKFVKNIDIKKNIYYSTMFFG